MASIMSRLQLGGMKADLVEQGGEVTRKGVRHNHHQPQGQGERPETGGVYCRPAPSPPRSSV